MVCVGCVYRVCVYIYVSVLYSVIRVGGEGEGVRGEMMVGMRLG